MKFYQIVIFSLLTANSCSQNTPCNYIEGYFPFTSKATILVKLGEYAKAYELFEKAFNSCEPLRLINHNDLFNFAKCAIKVNEGDTKEIILKSFTHGIEIQAYLRDSDFFKYIYDNKNKSQHWEQIEMAYPKLRKEYLEGVNYSLRDSISALSKLDQEYRRNQNLSDNIRRQKGIERDISVQRALQALISRYGYIDIPQIGGSDIDGRHISISGILLHIPDEKRLNYWIPLLKREVLNGHCSPYTVGSMIDQYYIYKGNKAKLGVMLGSQVDDIAKANTRRKEIGLPDYKMDSLNMELMKL